MRRAQAVDRPDNRRSPLRAVDLRSEHVDAIGELGDLGLLGQQVTSSPESLGQKGLLLMPIVRRGEPILGLLVVEPCLGGGRGEIGCGRDTGACETLEVILIEGLIELVPGGRQKPCEGLRHAGLSVFDRFAGFDAH